MTNIDTIILFRDYEQQIERLRNKYGLIINNDEFAIHALSSMSYYDLVNGYQDIFIKNGKYINDMTIERLYTFHLFDKKFQNALLRQSVFIENMFKTKLAQILSNNIGVHEKFYLDKKYYFSFAKDDANITFSKLKSDIERVYRKNIKYVHQPSKHYILKYKHIPPWILFKNISFSNIINLYRLLKSEEKSEITNQMIPASSINYSAKIDFLINSLSIIRNFRNEIAHNLRVVTYYSSNKLAPKTLRKLSPYNLYNTKDSKDKVGINDMYSMIMAIVILLDNPFLIQDFLNEILLLISSKYNPMLKEEEDGISESLYKDYAQITNLPLDLEDRIIKLFNYSTDITTN